jgi:hypothetical protein
MRPAHPVTWENACLHMRLPTSTPTAGNHSSSTQQWRPSHKLVSNILSQPGKLKQLPQKCFCRRGLGLCSAPDLHDQSPGAQLCNQPFTLKCFRCPNIQIPSTPLRQLEGSRAQIILPLAARSDRHYPLIYASAQRNRLLTHLMFLPPATQTTRRTVLALLS